MTETPPPPAPPDSICRMALDLAKEAARAGEVPVGSILCRTGHGEIDGENWEILATGRNRILEQKDPTAHAEMEAVRSACRQSGSERLLPDTVLVTTLEPCLMCTGALVLSRVDRVYFFAPGLKGVGMETVLRFSALEPRLNHHPDLIHLPHYQDETAALLREFFRDRRKRGE